MSIQWFAKDGRLICADRRTYTDPKDWERDMRIVDGLLRDREYKVVGQDELPNGLLVSTVWLGLDQRWHDDGPPIIFETMVFNRQSEDPWMELDAARYSTEPEAIAGHVEMVQKWRKWSPEKGEEDNEGAPEREVGEG